MSKIKRILKNWKVIILLLALFTSLISLNPIPGNEGVVIKAVEKNSSAELGGISAPSPNTRPTAREKIIRINQHEIKDIRDYYEVMSSIEIGDPVQIKTDENVYQIVAKQKTETIELDEQVIKNITRQVFNFTLNKTVNITEQVYTDKLETIRYNESSIGLSVADAPTSNLMMGLDLQGGTRIVLKPAENVSEEDFEFILDNIKQRLNVFGLSDLVVREAKGSSFGDESKYIIIEIAGVTKEEVKDLVARQGKFEAKVANTTVFVGGKDIVYVCRSADCSGIDPQTGCQETKEGYMCRFQFAISITPEAAKRHAQITENLETYTAESGSQYLSKPLTLFLDDELVTELQIGADLKGSETTDIAISGSGEGITRQDAVTDSLKEMKKLQTVLLTGSLPVELETVKIDTVSPSLGKSFVDNAILTGIFVLLAVIGVIVLRYRNLKIAMPIIINLLSEVIIILGVASLIKWNIDMAAIAGILIAIGSGVDDQIVIIDELMSSKKNQKTSFLHGIKSAFGIIMVAFTTTVAAMIPLIFAGAGLLKGFALTTIIGVSVGVLITRPAFAEMVRVLLEK